MLPSAFAAASEARTIKEKMEREKRMKIIQNLKKPRKQGWYKPGTKPQSSRGVTRSTSTSARWEGPTRSASDRGHQQQKSTRSTNSGSIRSGSRNSDFDPNMNMADESSGHMSYNTGIQTAPARDGNMIMEHAPPSPALSAPRRRVANRMQFKRTSSVRMLEQQQDVVNNSRHAAARMMLDNSRHSSRSARNYHEQQTSNNNFSSRGMDHQISINEEGSTTLSISLSEMSSSQNKGAVADALLDHVDNEKMCDVTLLGRKGTKVRAIKYVMACRSTKLQELLFSAHSQSGEVYVGEYGELAILALKEYCHKGDVNSSALVVSKKNADSMRGLMELALLAKDYGFEALYAEADSIICQEIDACPWFATAAYDAAFGGNETRDIQDYLIQFINDRSPDLLLDTNAMKHLSTQRLDVFLDLVESTNSEIFQYIQRWMELTGSSPENMEFAQGLAYRKVSLEALVTNPEMMSSIRSSGLFSCDEVETAVVLSLNLKENENYNDDGEHVTLDIFTGAPHAVTRDEDDDGDDEAQILDIYPNQADEDDTEVLDILTAAAPAVASAPVPTVSPPTAAPSPPSTQSAGEQAMSLAPPSPTPTGTDSLLLSPSVTSSGESTTQPGTLSPPRAAPQPGTVTPTSSEPPAEATPIASRRPGLADEGLPPPKDKKSKKDKKAKKKAKKAEKAAAKALEAHAEAQVKGLCYQLSPGGDVLVCQVEENIVANDIVPPNGS